MTGTAALNPKVTDVEEERPLAVDPNRMHEEKDAS